MINIKELGELIKSSPFTYEEISQKTGINRLTILKIANGEHINPTYNTLLSLIGLLGDKHE
jgi:transcriptional regulator with XRE-family HTH domain